MKIVHFAGLSMFVVVAVCAFAAEPGAVNTLSLTVHDTAGLDGVRAVTGGVPLPEGAALAATSPRACRKRRAGCAGVLLQGATP